jgi:hypothetical protein
MSDTPYGTGVPPSSRPNLSLDGGAARLAPVGTQGAPRPEPRNQVGQRLSLNRAPQSSDPNFGGDDLDFLDPRNDQRANIRQPQNGQDEELDILDPRNDQPGNDSSEPVSLTPDAVLWQTDDGTPVTLEEAQRGYLRVQDYHRKTGVLSQARQEVQQTYSQLLADREAVAGIIMRSLPDLSPETVARSGMDGATVARLQSEANNMIGFVQQLRQRTASEQQDLEQREIAFAKQFVPELIPDWIDNRVMDREIELTMQFLAKRGVPAETQRKLARDPYLAWLAVEAMKHQSVRMGGERGRQSQNSARQGQGTVNPSLPAQDQAQAVRPGGRQREQLRQTARAGTTMRQRMNAGVQLLGGAPNRR